MRSLVLSKVDCFLADVCSALMMLSSMVRNVCKLREHKDHTGLDLYFPLIILYQIFYSESRGPRDGNFYLDHYTTFKMGQPTFGDDSEAATGAKSSNQVACRSNLICIFSSLCWLGLVVTFKAVCSTTLGCIRNDLARIESVHLV